MKKFLTKLYVWYKVKTDTRLRRRHFDFFKLVKVAKSCVREGQCDVARNMVVAYLATYPELSQNWRDVVGVLVDYIIDTDSFIKFGEYSSCRTEWKKSYKFPDINDYMYPAIRIKF